MKFDLNAGDIIGIGQKRTFDALYQNDIIKMVPPSLMLEEMIS